MPLYLCCFFVFDSCRAPRVFVFCVANNGLVSTAHVLAIHASDDIPLLHRQGSRTIVPAVPRDCVEIRHAH